MHYKLYNKYHLWYACVRLGCHFNASLACDIPHDAFLGPGDEATDTSQSSHVQLFGRHTKTSTAHGRRAHPLNRIARHLCAAWWVQVRHRKGLHLLIFKSVLSPGKPCTACGHGSPAGVHQFQWSGFLLSLPWGCVFSAVVLTDHDDVLPARSPSTALTVLSIGSCVLSPEDPCDPRSRGWIREDSVFGGKYPTSMPLELTGFWVAGHHLMPDEL